jgi:site-specific DNA-methyltransferase (adenine-specific)
MKVVYDNGSIMILAGDCLDLLSGLNDRSVALAASDPPYNVGKDYEVYNDNLPHEEYVAFITQIIADSRRASGDNIAFYVGSKLTKLYFDLIPDSHLIPVHKRAIGVMQGNFFLQYHSLFVTGKPVKKTKDLWDDIRLPGEGYFYREQRYGHPGETAVALMERIVTSFSNPGDTVLDPFLGVGATAVACAKTDRKFIGIDLNERYCEIAKRRVLEVLQQPRLDI